jgi:NDP-sugar pyrophosphorylase family protein
MKAMVLAAGVGSRLRPLTDSLPKALLEVGGRTMLEIVVERLKAAGVTEIIVNVHHLPDQIAGFIRARGSFGIRVELSREEVLLDTGGGLKKASWFFDDGRPFLVHNVDVLTDLDLGRLLAAHSESGALATLAVRERTSRRQLLFDDQGRLAGRRETGSPDEWAGPELPSARPLAFDGIHALSPAIFERLSEGGVFPVTRAYLRLAKEGERIQCFRSDASWWADIGDPARLEAARRVVETSRVPPAPPGRSPR